MIVNVESPAPSQAVIDAKRSELQEQLSAAVALERRHKYQLMSAALGVGLLGCMALFFAPGADIAALPMNMIFIWLLIYFYFVVQLF